MGVWQGGGAGNHRLDPGATRRVEPRDVARAAVDGMFAGKATVVPGLSAKAMNLAMRLTPRPVVRFIQDHSGLLPGPRD